MPEASKKAIDYVCYSKYLSIECLVFPISKVIVMSVSAAAAGYFIFMPISLRGKRERVVRRPAGPVATLGG